MNNPVVSPASSEKVTSPARRGGYLSRKICLVVIIAVLPLLLWLEVGKPTLTEDTVLAPLVSMTLTRLLGATVFLALLLYKGYHVIHPLQKPFLKGLLFTLPPFLVVVNNLPILSMIGGDAYLVHNAPVYLLWFAAECLAIGLFEELAFRGVIFLMFAEKRHTTRKGLFWSLILSSAVFGGVHLINLFVGGGIGVILQIGYSFLIGAMCSVVLLKTRNVWLCVILHAIFDFGGKLIDTLGAGKMWDTPTVILTVVLAVATTVYLVWQFFKLDLDEVGKIFKA